MFSTCSRDDHNRARENAFQKAKLLATFVNLRRASTPWFFALGAIFSYSSMSPYGADSTTNVLLIFQHIHTSPT